MTQRDKKADRHIAIVALGSYKKTLAFDFIQDLSKRGCHMADVRVSPMADQVCISALLVGNWSTLGKLETALPGIADKHGLKITSSAATVSEADLKQFRPYAVEIISPAKQSLLPEVLDFFHNHDALIAELSVQEYHSVHTGSAMCTLNMIVNIPLDHRPQALRESYMDLCDELNADGLLDPIKT